MSDTFTGLRDRTGEEIHDGDVVAATIRGRGTVAGRLVLWSGSWHVQDPASGVYFGLPARPVDRVILCGLRRTWTTDHRK